jgi:hypothetical protein
VPASAQPFGAFSINNVTALPSAFQVPAIDGQPWPDNEKLPEGSNCSVKSLITSGCDGSEVWPATSGDIRITNHAV